MWNKWMRVELSKNSRKRSRSSEYITSHHNSTGCSPAITMPCHTGWLHSSLFRGKMSSRSITCSLFVIYMGEQEDNMEVVWWWWKSEWETSWDWDSANNLAIAIAIVTTTQPNITFYIITLTPCPICIPIPENFWFGLVWLGHSWIFGMNFLSLWFSPALQRRNMKENQAHSLVLSSSFT